MRMRGAWRIQQINGFMGSKAGYVYGLMSAEKAVEIDTSVNCGLSEQQFIYLRARNARGWRKYRTL